VARVGSPELRSRGISDAALASISSSDELAIFVGCDQIFYLSCGGTLATVSLSADGNSLVFGGVGPEGTGKGIRVLALGTHQISTLPDSAGKFSPRWSPDGRYIVALPLASPDALWLFDRTTTKWAQLCQRFIGYPSWLPDSKYVYFDSPQGEPAFYRVRISDHKLEMVASLKNMRLTGTFAWTGLVQGDTPLVLRDAGTQEIYAFDWQAPGRVADPDIPILKQAKAEYAKLQ